MTAQAANKASNSLMSNARIRPSLMPDASLPDGGGAKNTDRPTLARGWPLVAGGRM
jgi:hypothetical protein